MYKLKKRFNSRLGRTIGLVLLLITVIFLPTLFVLASGVYTAVIIMSGTMDFASGRLGGIVYSHKGKTVYFKNYRKVHNPNSPSQSVCRSFAKIVTEYWNSVLVDDQRTAWNNYALLNPVKHPKTGQLGTISGLNWFQKANNKSLPLAGIVIPPMLDPPDPLMAISLPILTSLDIIATEAYVPGTPPVGTWVVSVSVGFTGDASALTLMIAVSPPMNAGRSRVKTQFLFFNPAPISGTPIVVTSPYNIKYGKDVDCVGKKIFVEAWFVNPLGNTVTSPKIANFQTISV